MKINNMTYGGFNKGHRDVRGVGKFVDNLGKVVKPVFKSVLDVGVSTHVIGANQARKLLGEKRIKYGKQ